MDIPILSGPIELDDFVRRCADELFNREPYTFIFPEDCFLGKWPVDEIRNKNKNFLATLREKANIYAIFVRDRGSKSLWQRMYVGERKSSFMRDRMREHLIKKNDQTGSVLNKIKMAISSNKEVGLSFINVKPDSLRLFVEEEIIKTSRTETELSWNTHG